MVNYAGRPNYTLSEQASFLWWRFVVVVMRGLKRLADWARPILVPLKPWWWVPLAVMPFGFVFGLSAALLLG